MIQRVLILCALKIYLFRISNFSKNSKISTWIKKAFCVLLQYCGKFLAFSGSEKIPRKIINFKNVSLAFSSFEEIVYFEGWKVARKIWSNLRVLFCPKTTTKKNRQQNSIGSGRWHRDLIWNSPTNTILANLLDENLF